MISFKTEPTSQAAEMVKFVCPRCGRLYSFYYRAPNHCTQCDLPIPDITDLRDMDYAKLSYHREREK